MVGPRLRRVREQRGVTLTEVARLTGISKSTLSRLENGQRRPSLELLLPLAQTYRVPIDDLVGAPEVGDPRIRLKPRRVNGRTVLPLTHPGGIQAWKIVIPKSQSEPKPRTHDGFEWLYVLSGQMRLVMGDQDIVLGTARPPSSTPRFRIGSAAPATGQQRCSASSVGLVNGSTLTLRQVRRSQPTENCLGGRELAASGAQAVGIGVSEIRRPRASSHRPSRNSPRNVMVETANASATNTATKLSTV